MSKILKSEKKVEVEVEVGVEVEAGDHSAVVSLKDAMNMVTANACKSIEMLNDLAFCVTCGKKPFTK